MNTKKYTYHVLLLGIMLLLSCCFSVRKYVRPQNEVVTTAQYRTDSLPADSISIATLSYKDFFKDPVLQGYIEEGLKNNIDIRIAIQQILISEAFVKQGRAQYWPALDGLGQYIHQELSSNSQFGNQFNKLDVYELSAALSWELDIWGKIKSGQKAALATYLQTVEAHKAVKSTLVASIASSYYQLSSLDEQVRITKETIINRENSLETTQSLKESGALTEVAVKQTEAQLYNAQALLIELENSVRLLENNLSILLGSDARSFKRGELRTQEMHTELSVGIPLELLTNRPDVAQAEYGLMNAFELTNVAHSRFYPSMTLSAEAGLQSLDFDQLFNGASFFSTLIGGLTQPIFNRREIKTGYEVANAEQEQAKLDFRLTVLRAAKEVSDALYTHETATRKLVIKEKELRAYKHATQYSEELLTYGLIDYLDVLNARENSLSTSLELTDIKYNQLQAVINLYEALGGGWR